MAHLSPQSASRFFQLVLNNYERASSKNHQWQKFSSFNFKLSCFSMKDEHCASWEAVDSYFYHYVWGKKINYFLFCWDPYSAVAGSCGYKRYWYHFLALLTESIVQCCLILSYIVIWTSTNDEIFRETGNLVSRFEWLRWLDVRKSSEWDPPPPGVFRLTLISNWLW